MTTKDYDVECEIFRDRLSKAGQEAKSGNLDMVDYWLRLANVSLEFLRKE